MEEVKAPADVRSFENAVKQLIEKDAAIKSHERAVKALKTERADLEREILEHFANTGMSSSKIDGVTVFMRRDIYAATVRNEGEGTDESRLRAITALREAGYENLVKEGFSASAVASLFREWEQEGEEPPEELKGAIEAGERFSIRLKRS